MVRSLPSKLDPKYNMWVWVSDNVQYIRLRYHIHVLQYINKNHLANYMDVERCFIVSACTELIMATSVIGKKKSLARKRIHVLLTYFYEDDNLVFRPTVCFKWSKVYIVKRGSIYHNTGRQNFVAFRECRSGSSLRGTHHVDRSRQ